MTLEEDLKRRDFTINSIAKDENGSLIDPHGGLEDLKDKIFRQTSESFSEDPLRSIRYAKLKHIPIWLILLWTRPLRRVLEVSVNRMN